jgi:hypothetical protein
MEFDSTESGALFGGAPAAVTKPIGGAMCGKSPACQVPSNADNMDSKMLRRNSWILRIIRRALMLVKGCHIGATSI